MCCGDRACAAGTNLADAQEVVNALLADVGRLPEPSGLRLAELLSQRGVSVRPCLLAAAWLSWLQHVLPDSSAPSSLITPRLSLVGSEPSAQQLRQCSARRL